RDPWFYDETTLNRVKNATLDRYRLLPYWYHAFALYVYCGKPIISPLWYAFLDDPNTYKCNSPGCDSVIDQQVLIGTDIMVRGVVEKGAKSVKVYFPPKTQWYSTTGKLMSSGYVDIQVTMDDIPRFFRAGSIIPRKDTYRSSSKLMYNDYFALYVYLDPSSFSAEGYAYTDDTISYDSTDEDKHNFWILTFKNGQLTVSPGGGTGQYSFCVHQVIFIGLNPHLRTLGGARAMGEVKRQGVETIAEIPPESCCVP
ncbi:hypothetical protein FOZ63_009839, partial [Perkinsus olseni]